MFFVLKILKPVVNHVVNCDKFTYCVYIYLRTYILCIYMHSFVADTDALRRA